MSKKLFVSNIDFDVTEEQLNEMFSEFGEVVSAVLAFDRETKRSKGFAFVEMVNGESAEKAIKDLNNKSINGRPMKVCEDRGKGGGGQSSDSSEGSSAGGKGGGKRQHEHLPPMQRLNLFKRKKKLDPFSEDPSKPIDYRDVATLSRFVSERGKILSRRLTGLSAFHQRKVAKAIKRAQSLGLMPYSS